MLSLGSQHWQIMLALGASERFAMCREMTAEGTTVLTEVEGASVTCQCLPTAPCFISSLVSSPLLFHSSSLALCPPSFLILHS